MKNETTKKSQNYGIYLIYDKLAELYGLPFVAPTNDIALRTTAIEFAGTSSMAVSDINIYEVGQFCKETGELEVYPKGSEILVATAEDILDEVERLKSFVESVREKIENESQEKKSKVVMDGGNE
jgi:hypothetical protein